MNTNESPFDLAAVMVSTFANAQTTTPTNHRPVLDVLEEIRNGPHRAAIAAVRSAYAQGGKAAAAPLKKALQGFTPAGTFTHRADNALAARSGLIVADLDDLTPARLAAVRSLIETDPFTFSVFTSPTGTGLKVLYRCDLTRPHPEAFAAARAHVLAVTGEGIDESGKNVSRLCFVSDDPALFINDAAQVLPAAPAATVEAEPKPDAPDLLDSLDAGHGKPDAETVAALLACIPPRPEYGQWLRIASAVWDALGEFAGCDALEAWSPEEIPNEYRSKYRHRLPTVRAGTLFHIAKEHSPGRVAAIKSGVGASGWFPAATWGEPFAAAWCAALEADATTPRPALAVRLLTTEANKLARRGFAPAELTAARARLVELAAAVSASGDKFAAAELEGIGCKLLEVAKGVFRAAVKSHTEAKQAEAEAVAQARALEALDGETGENPVYFDGSAYWRREAQGAFGKLCRDDARLHLNRAGLSKIGDPSPCDAKLHELQTRNRVDYAGPLCGRPAGLHNENGLRVLATRGPTMIETKAGAWPVIDSLLSNLLGRAAGDAHAETQKALLLAWIKTGREALRHPSDHIPTPVLALVGPPDCGKSLLQSAILTPALGGRCADPGLFFTGQTPFNADIWGAEHLAIGDKALDVNGSQRSKLRNELKRVAASDIYPLHGKGRDALTFRPVWRVSLSANDDTESAGDLPTLDGGFADKIIYLKCYAPPAPFYSVHEEGARKRFSEAIRNELPAFLHFVDGFEIPAPLRKGRFGVTEWHHPAVLALLGEGDPLRPFADLLEAWVDTWPEKVGFQLLPTIELFRILDTEAHGGLARQKLCSGPKHLGHLLAKLAEKPDWRGRLSHATKREGGRTVNRSQACWRIEREDLL